MLLYLIYHNHTLTRSLIGSGLCVRTFTGSAAEVTSIEINADGDKLLAATKCNTNDLYDLRTVCMAYGITYILTIAIASL